MLFQCIESFRPIGELGLLRQMCEFLDGFREIAQLLLDGQLMTAYIREIVLAVEELVYEKSLADTTTTIDNDELRLFTRETSFQLLDLALSTD